jgi:MoxR-like ATPase
MQVAESLGKPFASVSCTAGMSEAAFKGRLLPVDNGNFRYVESDFVRLYRNGGVFLLDECDALDGNVAMTLNNALAGSGFNNELIIDGNTFVPRHPDFVCIAAANTFGTGATAVYAGRERLDEAFLDRFRAGRIAMDYDREFERQAVDGRLLKWGWDVRKNITDNRIHKVLSTRFLIESTKLIQAGVEYREVVDTFFADWKSDDRQRVDVAV